VRRSVTAIFLFFFHHFQNNFRTIMPIDSDFNKFLSVISLQVASKDGISKGLPTCEHPEDLFINMVDHKAKVEATFRLIVDKKIMTDIDIHRVMFVFD
jgi:hypothetical protein